MRKNRWLIYLLPLLTLVLLWECLSLLAGTDKFPHTFNIIWSIIRSFTSDPIIQTQGGQGYSSHIYATLRHFLIAFIAGSLGGLFIAIILAQVNFVLRIANLVVEFLRIIPPLLFIPFIYLFIGSSDTAIIFIPLVYSFYSIFIYSINAIENIDKHYILLGRQFQSTKYELAQKVILPAVLPNLFNGLKVTASLTLGIVIVAEYLESSEGIGSVIKFSISYTNIELVIVGIFWAILIAIITVKIISLSFIRLLKWQ